MSFQQADQVCYFTFDSFMDSSGHRGVRHGVFTRRGGVSTTPWQALNVGGTVGDHPQSVHENRLRMTAALPCTVDSLYDVWQVHSAEVVCTDRPRPAVAAHLRADAILTDTPGVVLFMRFADCVPVLLYDPSRKVIGLVHAGWQGTVKQIVRLAVEAMQAKYCSSPGDILAGIGPSIGAHHYEVGPEVAERVREAFGVDASGLLPVQDGKMQFDLWEANRLLLERAGVDNVEVSGICTACHTEDWYSHRAEQGKTGRFGALIGL